MEILEMRNTMIIINNAMNGFNSRLYAANRGLVNQKIGQYKIRNTEAQ